MTKILAIKNNIFDLPPDAELEINKISSELKLDLIDSSSDYLPDLKEAEIIFGWPKTDFLKKAEKLKWLHLPSAGVDRYADKKIYHNSNIKLTNSSGVYGKPIAEHVFALILAHNRNLIEAVYNKKNKIWDRKNKAKDFFNSTVGILGLGDIGSTIAKRAKCWGAKVLALKRTMIETPEYVDEIYLTKDLDKILMRSDYLILCLPGTSATKEIIGAKELKLMKKTAFVVNIGRGNLIEPKALIKALKNDWIAGAGLDVTKTEPLPEESELWNLDNVILTPHSSGFSPTNDQRRFNIFKKNLKRYINNDSLINKVDFKLKY